MQLWQCNGLKPALAFSTLLLIVTTLHTRAVNGDADFDSVRVKFDYEDNSGRGGDPENKYWRTYWSLSLDTLSR